MQEKEITMDEIDGLLEKSNKKFKTGQVKIKNKYYKWDEIDSLSEELQKIYHNDNWNLGKDNNNGLVSTLTILNSNKEKVSFNLLLENKTKNDLYFIVSGDLSNHFRFRKINNYKVYFGGIPFLYSGENFGVVIKKSEKKIFTIEFNNRRFYNKETEENGLILEAEVDLDIGKYEVYCGVSVDRKYFCPVSHLRYKDIKKLAKKENVKLWKGNIVTNKLFFEI